MTKTIYIDKIEGNSNLGNPVFSNFAKMNNYQYIALTPHHQEKEDLDPEIPKTKEDMLKF
jgi:hypothetical protein